MSTTLLQLRILTRLLIDEQEDTAPITWTNAELHQYINLAQSDLWVFLAKQDDSFGLREATATLVQGQNNYNYPSDILGNSIRALYAYSSGTDPQQKIRRGSIEEVVEEGIMQNTYPSKFACLDTYFQIGPPPNGSGYTLRIYYNRSPSLLSADTDTMESDDTYAENIAVGAAIRALSRINRDTSGLEKRMNDLKLDAASSNAPEDLMSVSPAWKY